MSGGHFEYADERAKNEMLVFPKDPQMNISDFI